MGCSEGRPEARQGGWVGGPQIRPRRGCTGPAWTCQLREPRPADLLRPLPSTTILLHATLREPKPTDLLP